MWFLIPVFGTAAAAGGTLALAGVYTSAANLSSTQLRGTSELACCFLGFVSCACWLVERAHPTHRHAGAEGAEDYPWPFWQPWFDSASTTKATAAGSVAAGVAAVASFTVSRRLLWQRVAQQLQPRDLSPTARIESFGQFVRVSAPWCVARLARTAVWCASTVPSAPSSDSRAV